ncbi:hypothetical protein FGO68_gene596 [Halteria grandinella]|uniref:Uncharacterized protein n=1 Tax=Halteria grandinella TaxID=5974 RepID=A0A8J8SWV8_HALGN|nr:hypothetical protein FGO68_gene596 [Halteria grandinella]
MMSEYIIQLAQMSLTRKVVSSVSSRPGKQTISEAVSFSTPQDRLRQVGHLLYNHKFKVIFFLIFAYGCKKAYDLYQYIKPFLAIKDQLTGAAGAGGANPLAALMGGGGAGKPVEPPANQTEAQKTLYQLLEKNPHVKQMLKFFKTTARNISSTIVYQPSYLHSDLVEPFFQSTLAKSATSEPGLTPVQRLERWSHLKFTLTKQIFAQVYSTRIVNLFSIIQLSLTGQRLLAYEVTKPKKETGAEDEGLKGLMQMLDGNDEEEEHKHEEGKEELTEEQKSELKEADKKQEQEQCQAFMSSSFTNLVRKVLEEQVFPLAIAQNVEHVMRIIDIKGKLSAEDFEDILGQIHDRVMGYLFKESQTLSKSNEKQQENSNDDTDSESNQRPRFGLTWLIEKIVEEYRENQEIQAQIKDNARLRDIFEEFIDMIETEYFESALFDTLDQSFHLNIRSFLLAQLSAQQHQPQAPQEESTLLSILPDPQTSQDSIFPDRTTKVPFIKVLTQINVIHQNSLIVEALKSLDFSSIPDSTATEQIESLLKLIFFEDEVFCGIPSKDLFEAASERQAANGGLGGLGDLSKLLNMDNMDGLMKMMEQLQ